MTHAFLRVKRNGSWENVEVEHLTDEERKEIFQGREKEELLRWLDLVCEQLAGIDSILQKEKEKAQ